MPILLTLQVTQYLQSPSSGREKQSVSAHQQLDSLISLDLWDFVRAQSELCDIYILFLIVSCYYCCMPSLCITVLSYVQVAYTFSSFPLIVLLLYLCYQL